MTTSPVLGLPYIAASQSQPEVTHNAALNLLQSLTYGVKDKDLAAPPGSPAEGDTYIVGAAATGAWTGRTNSIAGFFGGSWFFLPDRDDTGTIIAMGPNQAGMRTYVKDEQFLYIWNGSGWSSTGVGPLISA